MSTFIGALTIGFSVLVALGGLYGSRRVVPASRLAGNHDVAGFIFGVVGMIYAVLVAFVVIIVWQQFDSASQGVNREADDMKSISRLARGFPEPIRTEVRTTLLNYAEMTVEKEWPAMISGGESREVGRMFDRLWLLVDDFEPKSGRETVFYTEFVRTLINLGNDRRLRIFASTGSLPATMWFVLIFGGLVTVTFTYFFGVERTRAQALMTILLTIEIGLSLLVIAALDHPFTGDVRVGSESIKAVMKRLKEIDADEREFQSQRTVPTRPMNANARLILPRP